MNIKTTILTFTAAAMIAGSAFSMASAASRELGEPTLQDGYTNSDGAKSFGYSANQSPVSKLQHSDSTDVNQPTWSGDR